MALPPKNASEYAKLTLESLAAHNLGDKLSLGGAFGLLHYLDYRSTHHRARLAIETHLARISQHRSLEKINDPTQRTAAQQVREWFSTGFLNVLRDRWFTLSRC